MAALTIAFGSACSGVTPDVSTHSVPARIGNYQGKAWIRPEVLVVAYNPEKEGLGQPIRLWSVALADGRLDLLPVSQDDPACILTEYKIPTALADGRLGFVKYCARLGADKPQQFTVLAYDLDTGQVESLGPPVDFIPRQFDWNPSAGRGIVAKSNDICATIAWLTPEGLEYLSAVIDDEEGTFRLDDGYTDVDPDCSKGRADWPAWSPDGKQVAFFASPRSVGVEGMARLSEPWNLYLMDPEDQRPRKVLEDITNPLGARWSPDSRWLAFSGEMGGPGTWLLQPETGRLVQVSQDLLGPPAWSPEGTRIVGLVKKGAGSPAQRGLVILDVESVVAGK